MRRARKRAEEEEEEEGDCRENREAFHHSNNRLWKDLEETTGDGKRTQV